MTHKLVSHEHTLMYAACSCTQVATLLSICHASKQSSMPSSLQSACCISNQCWYQHKQEQCYSRSGTQRQRTSNCGDQNRAEQGRSNSMPVVNPKPQASNSPADACAHDAAMILSPAQWAAPEAASGADSASPQSHGQQRPG